MAEPDPAIELRHRPLVFVADVEFPILDDRDRHHMAKVARVRDGDPIAVADGKGLWRLARFGGDIEPEGPTLLAEANQVEPCVAFVPVKGERADYVVQKLTELGVDRIVPLFSERSVVRWDSGKVAKNHDRNLLVAREASMQSKRVVLPEVLAAMPLAQFVQAEPDSCFAEPGGDRIDGSVHTILVGPEGGFSQSELAQNRKVCLPGGILRAETAAVVAGALLVNCHR